MPMETLFCSIVSALDRLSVHIVPGFEGSAPLCFHTNPGFFFITCIIHEVLQEHTCGARANTPVLRYCSLKFVVWFKNTPSVCSLMTLSVL